MSVKYCPFASWDKSVVNDPEISKQWCIDSCALWSNGGCGLLPSVSGDSEIERLWRVKKAAKAGIAHLACGGHLESCPRNDNFFPCALYPLCEALAKEPSHE